MRTPSAATAVADDPEFETAVDDSVTMLRRELPATAVVEPAKRPSKHALIDKLRLIAASEGFDVEDLLGRGGMGAVLLARDRELGRKVALKFLAAPKGKEDRINFEMLRKEAERASRLTHENVVQVYSWHAVGAITFFVMEYVDGETIQQYVQREFRVSVEEILRIMAEACAGVVAAHELEILHRDIKPQNILIARNGRVKVADFGLASSALEERFRNEAVIAGTLGFMAPEQARAEPVTFRSDVYSLAATLYYALAKVSPYGQMVSPQAMLIRNQAGDHVPLAQVKPGLPPAVYRLVETGMSLEPARRYADAADFKKAIESTLLSLGCAEPEKKSLRDRMPEWLSVPSLLIGLAVGGAIGAAAVQLVYWFGF